MYKPAWFVACLCVASAEALAGGSIGINFTATSFGGGPFELAPGDVAGVAPQANWNNTSPVEAGGNAEVVSPISGTLVDHTGAATGTTVAWLADKQVNSDGNTDTPDERLFRGTIEGFFITGGTELEVTVSNVPYAKYDVIAYLMGFGFDTDASAHIGDQSYFYVQSSDFTTDGYIQATATTEAGATLATYAVFTGLTGSEFTLELFKTDGNRASLAGLQVVEVPEPSGVALLALSGLVVIRRGRSV